MSTRAGFSERDGRSPTGIAAESAQQGLTQRAAARLLGVSPSTLRASSCPKHLLPGNGPRGRPIVRYFRDEVLAWARGEGQGGAS